MAIDRTQDLLDLFESAVPSNASVSGIRNRHKKERFAVEDQESPSPTAEVFSDSDMERTTPPATFMSEATNIVSVVWFHFTLQLGEITQAERLLKAATAAKSAVGPEFQPIFNICLLRISTLQKIAADLASGILERLLDQHEEALVWFLNHRVSNLSRDFESYQSQLEKKEKEVYRIRQMRKTALASSRPATMELQTEPTSVSMDQFVEGYGIPAEKMQALQLENDALVREYMDMQEQVSTTQASLNDIARLQSTLQEQLVYQAAQIDCLYDDAATTVDTVRKANTHLNQAASRQSTSVKLFIWFIFFASLFVLLLHRVNCGRVYGQVKESRMDNDTPVTVYLSR
ncbi:hypothetical protein PSACC_02492 [Paramicrosporidium saccamoebae]|uniref:t-SNARE coiled-coil homology domain-containing protein n=1 Tax=Paramicrosporidium saccamoebae TaxID=1246581 RepID=A0A2H9TIV3_9FUNG|nr:hypothetical protein PSACC_02492 [Paramicrosporidium saccamoebae]